MRIYDNGTYRNETEEERELRESITGDYVVGVKGRVTTITLLGGSAHWTEYYDENDNVVGYYQVINEVANGVITENSKIDLQPSPDQLAIFHEKDVAFTVVNDDGVVTAYAIGVRPEQDYIIQCTITEVAVNG